MSGRVEPITYWVTLDETVTLPGFGRKLAQLEYGLHGQIPDGLLFRVSSIGKDESESFHLQERFLRELAQHVDPQVRARYFGK
jgi:EpsI family protein